MFCKCFVYFNKFVNPVGRRGKLAQALAQWRHTVASSEARDVLHCAMHPAVHHHICMVFEIASVSHVLFVLIDLLLATTIG